MVKRRGKDDEESGAVPFIRIILWPFKMLFVMISWIVKGIVFGVEWSIGLFSNREIVKKESADNPYIPFKTVKDIAGNFIRFEDVLVKKDSTIGLIIGARGSGKSAFGLKLLENLHTLSKRKTFTMGFKSHGMPSWVRNVNTLDEIENGSYVLIDEGGILFSARQGFSDANQLLSELLLIARHKDLSIIFITQNSSNLEINAIRQADYLVLKPSSLLQLDFERKKIKDIYKEVIEDFDRYRNVKGLTYIYSDTYKGFVSNPLPTFWSQSISKSFSGKKD
jgi:uncharacterized protein YneF (UPF0154 family)